MYEKAKKSMTEYYRKMDMVGRLTLRDKESSDKLEKTRRIVADELQKLCAKNPGISTVRLKSRVHMMMAELCEPVIFDGNPFFFETAMNESRSWGMRDCVPSVGLEKLRLEEIEKKHPEYTELRKMYLRAFERDGANLCCIPSSFDTDHHTLGYTKLFGIGIKGIAEEAQAKLKDFSESSDGYDFCMAVIESCKALVTIAHKFSDKAERLIRECGDEKQRHFLCLIKDGARRVPENPPETFYEGLAMLLFMRDVSAVLENIGISQLGHVDRLLGDLYQRDIKEGRITEEEARELVGIWMMQTDVKYDLENNEWPETSTCIQLGGCDEEGNPVFNSVTRIFIEEHHRRKLINPKLNCRYSKDSPEEYLKIIGRAVIDGHNSFALINDDLILDGLMRSGVELSDARLYVNGGCQETMIEGCGHTEGAALYVSFLRIFDLFLHRDGDIDLIKPVKRALTYEEFYNKFLQATDDFITRMTEQRNTLQSYFKEAICCPIYSASQRGCVENGKDYIRGGAKYNFSTIALVGFANTADSLYAIRELVYKQKKLTLDEMISVIENNWRGREDIRSLAVKLPKYGHNNKDADELANRLLRDVAEIVRSKKNERGGNYLPSTFVYNYNRVFAENLRATPDGRYDNEYMAAGCSPSLLERNKDITTTINSMSNVDFAVCGGGISVLDVMLPVSSGLDENVFASLMRACNTCRCVTLQPNVVSVRDMIDAKESPEKHKDLIVRICGLSAYFVALLPEVQDEIINRNLYSV